MATLRFVQWWALGAAFGVGCSINTAGFSADDGPVVPPASGGSWGSLDGAAEGDTAAPGTGGDPGSGGRVGSGGRIGSGGAGSGGAGSGGAFETDGGTGGDVASGGAPGSGGAGTGGRPGPGSGGATSSGGSSSGGATSSGGSGTGGASSSGGSGSGGASSAGGRGTGGVSSSGGSGSGGAPGAGTGGRSGTGGRAGNCNAYPDALAFVLPDDSRIHCYWFRPELLTWPEARKQCMTEKGGDLVTITNPAENDVVRGVAHFTGSFPQVWIGATDGRAGDDTKGPGTYRWVTNEPWGDYTNWSQSSPKQPDGYCDACDNGQPCTCDHRGTLAADGTWFDFWEENPRAYVCEAVPAAAN